MKSQFQPWQALLLILAGWINRRQQDAIEYLLTENRVLREKFGKKRILLNDDQRQPKQFIHSIENACTRTQYAPSYKRPRTFSCATVIVTANAAPSAPTTHATRSAVAGDTW